MMSTLISIENVSKGFLGMENREPIIRNINFKVDEDEVVSIVGPSGCGKTTLLKIIANISDPDSGMVTFNDSNIANARINHSIGYVPQNHTLLSNRTVIQNITLPLDLEDISDFRFALELLELIGLKEYRNYYPSQISGGMKQKVSIARALIYHPELLLLDEPFASVDEISREKYNLELLRLNKVLKRSIILVTHNIEEAVFMSDRVLIMSGQPGEISAQVDIPLGKSRSAETRSEDIFFSLTKRIRKLMRYQI